MEKMNLIFVGYVCLSDHTKGSRFREEEGERTILVKGKDGIVGGVYASEVKIEKGEIVTIGRGDFLKMYEDAEQLQKWKEDSWAAVQNIQAHAAERRAKKESGNIDKMTIAEAKESCGKNWQFRAAFKRYIADSF